MQFLFQIPSPQQICEWMVLKQHSNRALKLGGVYSVHFEIIRVLCDSHENQRTKKHWELA